MPSFNDVSSKMVYPQKPLVEEFIESFKKQWIAKYKHWYVGSTEECLSTNNKIETTNAVIKREHSQQERL